MQHQVRGQVEHKLPPSPERLKTDSNKSTRPPLAAVITATVDRTLTLNLVQEFGVGQQDLIQTDADGKKQSL